MSEELSMKEVIEMIQQSADAGLLDVEDIRRLAMATYVGLRRIGYMDIRWMNTQGFSASICWAYGLFERIDEAIETYQAEQVCQIH